MSYPNTPTCPICIKSHNHSIPLSYLLGDSTLYIQGIRHTRGGIPMRYVCVGCDNQFDIEYCGQLGSIRLQEEETA